MENATLLMKCFTKENVSFCPIHTFSLLVKWIIGVNTSLKIINTIFQLRKACQLTYASDIRALLQDLLLIWIARRPSRVNKNIRLLHLQANRLVPVMSTMWNNSEILFYSTVYIGHVRVTSAAIARGKKMNDSSVVVKIGAVEQFGIVNEIFHVKGYGSFLQVWCLLGARSFEFSTQNTQLSFENIQQGTLGNDCFIPLNNFIEKCVRIDHSSNCLMTFVWFPNLYENSWSLWFEKMSYST